jgi:hypothetical protein
MFSKVLISSWLVVFIMLSMQLSLNVIKFKSLVGEATASQMQVVGSTIEAVVDRAEQVGLAMEEIDGFREFIQREALSDKTIERISVLSAVGLPLFRSDRIGILDEHREAVVRRIFSAADQESTLSLGDWLYSGRLIYDSSGAVMGAIVLTAPANKFMPSVKHLQKNLTSIYAIIILLITATLVPTIFIQFRVISSIYHLLSTNVLNQLPKSKKYPKEVGLIAEKISEGNILFQKAEQAIDREQKAEQTISFARTDV